MRWPVAAPALLVQALVFGLGVRALQAWYVASVAWAGLYFCAVTAMAALLATGAAAGRRTSLNACFWLRVAAYAGLFGAIFWGANFALDALHGAHRLKADVAAHLGGLELWLVLCPGVCSVALGLAAQAVWPTSAATAKSIDNAAPAASRHRITTASLAHSKDRP